MVLGETLRTPGFVDLHDHYRQPSMTNLAETYESGTAAAVMGGYVQTNDMPNTPKHETWTEERVDEKHRITEESAWHPVGVWGGSQPQSDNIGEIAGMASKVIGFKFYLTRTTGNTRELEPRDFDEAMVEIARNDPNALIGIHPGEENLEEMIARACGDFGLRAHACHVHHDDQVKVLLAAKYKYGFERVSSGVTGHHLLMTTHDERRYGWWARMMPRLANQEQAEKLTNRLAQGHIDAVETDHAPHFPDSKIGPEINNPHDDPENPETCHGVPGVEFTPKLIFNLVRLGYLSMDRAIDAMSTQPARIADITLGPDTYVDWDMSAIKHISEDDVLSGAGWTPYAGAIAVGAVDTMSISGVKVIERGQLVEKCGRAVTRGMVI